MTAGRRRYTLLSMSALLHGAEVLTPLRRKRALLVNVPISPSRRRKRAVTKPSQCVHNKVAFTKQSLSRALDIDSVIVQRAANGVEPFFFNFLHEALRN